MRGPFLPTTDFAELAGISRQAAHSAFRNAANGQPWRKLQLVVRQAAAPAGGGRSGIRYEVALSSLSATLQERFTGGRTDLVAYDDAPANPLPVPASDQNERVGLRLRIVEDALEYPNRSAERRAEVERASRKWNVPVRTIQRWIHRLERAGGDVNALAHQRPSNAGERRVIVSRRFDEAFRAAGHEPAELLAIGEHVELTIKAVWTTKRQRSGWRAVGREVQKQLASELQARGYDLPQSALLLPENRINVGKNHRLVDMRAHDRKAFEDNAPSIRRDWTLLSPMERVCMDVKPIDCRVERPDGSTAYPRFVACMDLATQRVFGRIYLLRPGEGIRREHVAEVFIAMTQHPDWGFPRGLLLDNGSEYKIMDRLRPALSAFGGDCERPIIKALPYKGRGKPIENRFKVLDQFVFNQMDGWTSGNRLEQKTQTVGRPAKPYSLGADAFEREALSRIAEHERVPFVGGPFAGLSPAEHFARHRDDGWRPVRIDPMALDATFCERESRKVTQGAISIGGVRYRHDELPNGERVPLLLPWRRDQNPIVELRSGRMFEVEPELLWHPNELEGAKASGRAQSANHRRVRSLAHGLPQQPGVTTLPTAAAPAPLVELAQSDAAAAFTGARIEAADRRARRPSEIEDKLERRARFIAQQEKLHGPVPTHYARQRHGDASSPDAQEAGNLRPQRPARFG